MINFDRRLSIAPMMAYTDRHFRYFIRLITKNTLLYTEMVTANALIYGNCRYQLTYSPQEHPIALQLGGANPADLAQCARMAEEYLYDEINLNVGCPSDRVQHGQFGACLMKSPELIADIVSAMKKTTAIPITVKTRIGVDDLDSYEHLQQFVQKVSAAGCTTFIIHARKAWLKGLSPQQNRSVPPLRYDVVYQLKQDFPHLEIIINGGIKSLEDIQRHWQHVDGVMIGREAYANPFFLAELETLLGEAPDPINKEEVLNQYLDYAEQQCAAGVPFWKMSRHLMGLFQGERGARNWRRMVGENKTLDQFIKAFYRQI